MERFHRKPPESWRYGFGFVHRVELVGESRPVIPGYAEMVYLDNFYYVFYLRVEREWRGRGLGNEIVRATNDFLTERGRMGILRNIIKPDDPAHKIYTHNGWEPVGGQWHVFSAKPDKITPERVERMKRKIRELKFMDAKLRRPC